MPVKHNLPVLLELQIRNFTLYRNRSNMDISVRPGVFYLAGANRLGKSSFLAALNFEHVGIVASPTRNFLGAQSIACGVPELGHQS
jgi:recombinational DNA repair ATPase RecF